MLPQAYRKREPLSHTQQWRWLQNVGHVKYSISHPIEYVCCIVPDTLGLVNAVMNKRLVMGEPGVKG